MSKKGSAPRRRVVLPLTLTTFVCVSSAELLLLLSKRNKSNNSKGFAFASYALLRQFFTLNSAAFVGEGAIFLLPGSE